MNTSEKARRNLKEAISEVMETMYFVCLEPAGDGDALRPEGAWTTVRIETSGRARYTMELQFTETLLQRISDNVFGAAQPGDAQAPSLRDLALETANMVGGAFLNRFDPERILWLQLPQWVQDPAPPADGVDRNLYLVEGEPVWVSFGVEEGAPGSPQDDPGR